MNQEATQIGMQQTGQGGNRQDQITALQEELQKAMHIKNPQERQSKLNIIGARLEDLVKKDAEDQTTFAEKVRDLDNSLSIIDLEVDSYEKFTPEEQGWIDEAKSQLTKAEGAWFFKADKKAKAETEIAAAKQRAETARARRLQNATVEQSLNRYISSATAVKDQADARKTSAASQEVILQEQQLLTENELGQATLDAEELRAEVDRLEADKVDAERELNATNAGSPERHEAESKHREISGELDKALAQRDKTLGNIDALQKFLDQVTGSLGTQRKLKRNLEIVIQIIETGLDKRVPLIESRLDTMKTMETLKVARDVVGVGDDIDESNAEYMAQAANAADEFVTSYLEEQPDRIRKMREILAEQDENAREQAKRVNKLWEEYDAGYSDAA